MCESPLICGSGTPCPTGWLGLDNYCYHLVSTALTWSAADEHCIALQSSARLSSVVNRATGVILAGSFMTVSEMFVGISDLETGQFHSVDGSSFDVMWSSGEPDDAEDDEHCVEITSLGANVVSCSLSRPFICRLNRTGC